MRSRSAGDARPVRTLLNSCRVLSIDLSMRRVASARKSSIAGIYASLGVETSVPTRSPRTTRRMLPSASANTWMGRLLSMQRESAVVSITFRPRSIASRCVISVRSFAFESTRGSPSRTPSTACFAIRIASAPISSARSAAAVSVVKNGLPVPAAKMTVRSFSRWRIARRRMYGSATAPITIATSTARSCTSLISAAIASTVGRSIPYSRGPMRASPESFSRMRWKTGAREAAIACSELASVTEGKALELEHLGALLGERLRDRLRLLVDPRLVEEDAAALREVALVHHPVDDLLARLLGLRLDLFRVEEHAPLGGDRLLGHVLAGDPARVVPGDVHGERPGELRRAAAEVDERADLVRRRMDVGRDAGAVDRDEARRTGEGDVLAELRDELDALVLELSLGADALRVHELEHLPREGLELVVLGHGLGLAADGDHRPAVGVDVVADEALRRLAARALARLGHALLAQDALRRLEVAARVLERALAVHHPRAGLVAELLHELGRDLGHSDGASSPVSGAGSVGASATGSSPGLTCS